MELVLPFKVARLIRIVLLLSLTVCLTTMSTFIRAQDNPQPLSSMHSLERFNADLQLQYVSKMDIRGVNVGSNVREQTNLLTGQGAELQHISGGKVSTKVELKFRQAYQDSELVQNLALHFDKQYGFVNEIELTYKIASRYLDIRPVYQKTIEQAIAKYGEPLSLEQIRQLSDSRRSEPRLSELVENLNTAPELREEIIGYFSNKMVTSRTRFKDDGNGRALLLSGFTQCYFWSQNQFAELLSLCAFQPSSGNMKGQGITLSLIDFAVREQIVHFQQPEDGVEIVF